MEIIDLTEKQEKFAQLCVKLNNASAAYKASHDAENMTDLSVNAVASKLKNSDKVKARIEQIRIEQTAIAGTSLLDKSLKLSQKETQVNNIVRKLEGMLEVVDESDTGTKLEIIKQIFNGHKIAAQIITDHNKMDISYRDVVRANNEEKNSRSLLNSIIDDKGNEIAIEKVDGENITLYKRIKNIDEALKDN